ncbi:MAG TPA: trypsin-like peptidase domain-containing protein [Planctomycetaceae bacterium]|nr:trypsin-like peptidase domain-containing protein [Planctomycetaceae bacterium]
MPATVAITRIEHSEKKAETSLAKPSAAAPGGATKAGPNVFFWDQNVVSNPLAGALTAQIPGVAAVNVWCGVLIRPDGWIVTTSCGSPNAELEVRLTDGRALPARLVVDDRRTGLWLLKVALVESPSVSLATVPVELGQDVVAAMMDGPKSRQIARGIVTALNRHVDGASLPLILTDLPVPEAAAGAPVCNTQGELVGLVSAHGQGNDKHARVVTATFVNDLFLSRRDGAVTTIEPGRLGISVGDPGDDKLIVVKGVSGGSPAEKAGLQKGDRVESIDGRQFNSPEELMEYVGMKLPGSAVVVKYRRGEKDLVAAAVLAARPAPTPASPQYLGQTVDLVYTNAAGVTLTNPNSELILTTPQNGLTFTPNGSANSDPKAQINSWFLTYPQNTLQAPVVRVEKTDVEKRIDELRHDVGALTKGIDSIRSHLDKLGADLKALSESRNKK